MAAYHHAPWMFWVGVITAGMTAFYVFRALFVTFFGQYRGTAHPHESPVSMTGPLVILALLSAGGGFILIPKYLDTLFPVTEAAENMMLVIVSVSAGVIGIAIAAFLYLRESRVPAGQGGPLYSLVANKYYVDEVYNAALVRPLVAGSRTVLWRGMDQGVIDGIVNAFGHQSRSIGNLLRRIQSGSIRSYATWVVFGSVVLIVAMTIVGTGR